MAGSVYRLLATSLILLAVSGIKVTGQAAAPESGDQDFSAVDRYLEKNRRAMKIPGMALAIVHKDRILHTKGFGRADESGRPATAETPFQIASISKPVAAVAVMQLYERGLIDLDAPVRRYIPWFRLGDPDGGAEISVRHLLGQTSGIPRHAGYPPLTDRRIQTLEGAVRDLARFHSESLPGERFIYSNGNFAVLGLLVEAVSGQSYQSYVKANILEPLGMHRTYFTEGEAETGGLARGYASVFGFPVPGRWSVIEHTAPYYGLVSTAEDLARFAIPFLNGGRAGDVQLLSAESVAAMQRPAIPGSYYGLGWWVHPTYGRPSVRHGGDAFHFRNELIIWPDQDLALILLTNLNAYETASASIGELGYGAAAMLLGLKPYDPAGMYWRGSAALMLAAIIMAAASGLWVLLLIAWRERVADGHLGALPGVWVPALLSWVVGGGMLLWAPGLFSRGANWAMALKNQPDLTWTGLLFGCGLLLAGTHHLVAFSLRLIGR